MESQEDYIESAYERMLLREKENRRKVLIKALKKVGDLNEALTKEVLKIDDEIKRLKP